MMSTPQDHTIPFYSKYLNQDEIDEPLLMIREFFSEDWLPGHLESLSRWRKHVIEDGYYKHNDDNPAGLLYLYKLNVRLVEAMYVLSKTKRTCELARAIHIDFNEQLQQEEREWLHFPAYLSPQECINPYIVIADFFNAYTIDQYRHFLDEWLETGLSPDPIDETMEISEIIYFYENMQKLYEAVWVIRQREVEPALKKVLDNGEPEVTALVKRYPKELSLLRVNCSFNEGLTTVEKAGLDQLVDLICAEIKATLMIIYLGTYPATNTFYLLVVTDEKEKTQEHEIVNKVESLCKPLANVCAIAHKSDAFIRGLDEGSRFFYNVLEKHRIAYHSADFILPQLKAPDVAIVKSQIELYWNRWGRQAKSFLDTALSCHDDGNYNLSLFLMHQAAESTLSVIIRIVLGYRLSIHNLARMLRLTFVFTDDLKAIFDMSLTEDMQLFELLQNAYSAARYKEDFNPGEEAVKALSDKVCKLFITAEELYYHAIDKPKD